MLFLVLFCFLFPNGSYVMTRLIPQEIWEINVYINIVTIAIGSPLKYVYC